MGNYTKFTQQLREVTKVYPELKVSVRDGFDYLSGTFRIVDDDGKEWDSFEIEVHFTQNFPYHFPSLIEVGGKIPKIADWHINEKGNCCITIPVLEKYSCRNEITVLQFIQNHVKPYLFNQAYRIKKGYYAHKEFAHGIYGILEYYQEIFAESDILKVIKHLEILKTTDFGKTTPCYCGRKAKFRKCHPEVFKIFKPLGHEVIDEQISHLKLLLK